MKIILVINFVIIFCSITAFSQRSINLRRDITSEVAAEYDEYIKKYAPADSAFNVLIAWANRLYLQRRAAVSIYLVEYYKPLFPDKDSLLLNEVHRLEQVMIAQSAMPDIIPLYSNYIKNRAPSNDAFFAVQRIADYYIQRQLWDSAEFVYDTYKPLFPNYKHIFESTIGLFKAKLEGLKVENLGNMINTPGSEWDPTPTPDGRYLYFSADHRRGGNGNSDIWVSEKIDGVWQKSVNIGKPINGIRDETVDNVSVDGNTLLISGNFDGSYGEFDIYLAEKDSNGWGDIYHLPAPVNTEYHDESGCLSPDGKALIFSSDRPGGIGPHVPMNSRFYGGGIMGNMDLYVSLETDNGWSEPINLGPTINTPYAERAVYLHPDGKTLYFSSNGHYGFGRLDVYKTVRLNDTSWTDWSAPVNLGKEINTVNDDWGYVVDLEGEFAYFSKENDIDGFGGWDLYSISLPESAKPQPLAVIRGRVIDSTGKPIACNIVWEDLSTGNKVGHLKSDPRDGFYFITLPLGMNYGYYAERFGYYPTSNSVDLRQFKNDTTIYKDILMTSIRDLQERGVNIRINNIFFDFDKSVLKEESLPELKRLLDFANKVKNFKIIIEGHTDSEGTNDHNKILSLKRAEAVANYLTKNGIDNSRIITEGYGSERPYAPNDTAENKSLNRRVEVRLVK
ncbi:MAG: OmpA family protein [Candidatus Kapabacteria bacterium]|nr:OmpA family protein [Ignavibacteriota bacterium]MCW5883366.1 OmpA family protein [Candidatus Kapabacteria bacterium]